MPRSSKFISILTLLVIMLSAVAKPSAPVTASEPQTPTSSGSWSQAFAGPFKDEHGYMPTRPIEWNGTLYSGMFDLSGLGIGVGYWNGQQWTKLEGLKGLPDSLVVHQNRLYAAGSLMLGDKNINLAYWDGNLWTAMPIQFSTNVFVLASHNDQLYVGGYSEQIAGQPSGLLFRWDGTQWHTAAEGIYGTILSMLSRPDGLYLGGTFRLNGQNTGLIHWNGAQWQSIGGGVQGMVMDVEWVNNQLHISGQFTSTLEPNMQNVAAWNGTSWNTFGTGIMSPTHSLSIVNGELYALSKSGFSHFNLQRWDSNRWSTLSTLQENNNYLVRYPDAVLVNYQQELLAFGPISFVSGTEQSFNWGDAALRWKGDHWESMTPNGLYLASNVALASDNEDIYLAATRMFWGNGGATLAHLNASDQWQQLIDYSNLNSPSLDKGFQKYQQSFFIAEQRGLYQAGNNTWLQVSPANVESLAQANNLLYVAGDFEQFNGVTAHNLVTWNGGQWQALNTPAAFDWVTIVEADANYVYISDGRQLARWDGSQWTTLATNVTNIDSIEPTTNGVYIAGTFSSVDGVTVSKIAYWNGTIWSGLTGVIDGSINDLEMGADGLYVAGSFGGITNGIVSPGILRWDGSAWHGLAGGVQWYQYPGSRNGSVQRLAATPSRMVMYGGFNHVGNAYESSQIAAWEYGTEPLIKAKPDYGITYRPQPVTVNVVANDWSDQPNLLQLVSVSSPSHGTAVINGNSVVYTPEAQFEGVETLTYTVRDPINAVTTTAQLRLHVWNHFPKIADQEQAVDPFTETLLDPLDGLIDLNGDSLTITQASAITGTVTIVDNQLRYTPPDQEHFTDVATYTVSDGRGGQQTARINLYSVASAVVAVDDYATTYRPHMVNVAVLANDSSLNNEPMQLVAVSAASHGTATISGNQVHYIPAETFQGIETLEYTVRNQTRGVTATGTLTIAVQNHVPTVAPITITMHPNSTTSVDVLAHATDLNGDLLTITQAHSTYGTVIISNNRLHYTAPNYYPFAATISYTISDGHGGLREGTVVVHGLSYRLFLPYTSK